MRIRLALAALAACAASLAVGTAPASACLGTPCDQINRICHCLG
jgi:hypothetical protein